MYDSVFLLLCDISCWLVKLKNTHIDFAESFTCEINALKDSLQVALRSFRCEMDHSSICNRPFREALQSNLRIQGEIEGRMGNPQREIWVNSLRQEPGIFAASFFQFFSPAREGCQSLWDLTRCMCVIPGHNEASCRGCHVHPWCLSICHFLFLTTSGLLFKRLFYRDLLWKFSFPPN